MYPLKIKSHPRCCSGAEGREHKNGGGAFLTLPSSDLKMQSRAMSILNSSSGIVGNLEFLKNVLSINYYCSALLGLLPHVTKLQPCLQVTSFHGGLELELSSLLSEEINYC